MALMKHQTEATITRVKRSMASRITLFPQSSLEVVKGYLMSWILC